MNSQFNTVQDFINRSLRAEIGSLLNDFPPNQTDLFARAFPSGIIDLGEEKLRQALALCYRTEVANQAKTRTPDSGKGGRE